MRQDMGGEKVVEKKKKIILSCIIIAVVLIVIIVAAAPSISKAKKRKDFENMLNRVNDVVSPLIPAHFEDEELVKSVDCSIDSSFEFDNKNDWYDWQEVYTTRFYVDDSFDSLSNHEQYEIIDRLGRKAETTIYDEIEKAFPDHASYIKIYYLQDEAYGKYVTYNRQNEAYIITSKSKYEYAENLNNYYIKDNREIYVREEDGSWDGGSNYSNLFGDDTTIANPYSGTYDATLKYGSGAVLICGSEDAMERYVSAVNNGNQGTIDEMLENGDVAYTHKGTKCNIIDKKLTKCKVKLLDGVYAENIVWVVAEAVQELDQ